MLLKWRIEKSLCSKRYMGENTQSNIKKYELKHRSNTLIEPQ